MTTCASGSDPDAAGGAAGRLVPAAPGDADAVAALLAAAFHDDPVFAWLFPDPASRRARLARLFARLFGVELRHGEVIRSPGFEAASFWRAPGHAATPAAVFARHMPALLGLFGARVGRLFAVSGAIERHMPGEPFRYAHFVGVVPPAQRQGWGVAMMRAGFAAAARERVPVYLETARIENVRFYQQLGFAVTDEWSVPSGPRFWSLMRRA